MQPTCRDCKFFAFQVHIAEKTSQSLCLRFPPHPAHGYPKVSEQDWCGEYSKLGSDKPTDNRLVALVSGYDLRDTLNHLKHRKDILHLDPVNARGVLSDGSRFVVVTKNRDVTGLEFSRYEIIGKPCAEIVLDVTTRLRPTDTPPGQQGDESA